MDNVFPFTEMNVFKSKYCYIDNARINIIFTDVENLIGLRTGGGQRGERPLICISARVRGRLYVFLKYEKEILCSFEAAQIISHGWL